MKKLLSILAMAMVSVGAYAQVVGVNCPWSDNIRADFRELSSPGENVWVCRNEKWERFGEVGSQVVDTYVQVTDGAEVLLQHRTRHLMGVPTTGELASGKQFFAKTNVFSESVVGEKHGEFMRIEVTPVQKDDGLIEVHYFARASHLTFLPVEKGQGTQYREQAMYLGMTRGFLPVADGQTVEIPFEVSAQGIASPLPQPKTYVVRVMSTVVGRASPDKWDVFASWASEPKRPDWYHPPSKHVAVNM